MKKLGRRHRPFFRICAMDSRSPRDGKAIEELGTYDPMVPDTDRRVTLNNERIQYWLSVGAQPSDKVAVLIKKYAGKERPEPEPPLAPEPAAVAAETETLEEPAPEAQPEEPAAEEEPSTD
jgi:small subunit ribosomal protein S16